MKSEDRAVLTVSSFVAGLLAVDEDEAERLTREIQSNRVFHDSMEAKRLQPAGQRVPRASVNNEVGTILYAICRKLQPDSVVETGVASGVSSSYFLCALEENGHGRLHSIDYSTWEPETGWIVPDSLRYRWELTAGRSSEKLPSLLKRLGTIQVFFHDSEHTYKNMLWEYQGAWETLAPGGVLLSHNIDFTDAFPDFSKRVGARSWVFQNLGGIAKPLLSANDS